MTSNYCSSARTSMRIISTNSGDSSDDNETLTLKNNTEGFFTKREFLKVSHQILTKVFDTTDPSVECTQETLRKQYWNPTNYAKIKASRGENIKSRLELSDVAKWFPRYPSMFRKLVFSDTVTRNAWFNEKVKHGHVFCYILPMGYIAIVIRTFNNKSDVGNSMDRTRFCTRNPEAVIDPLFGESSLCVQPTTSGSTSKNYATCIKYGGSYLSPKGSKENDIRYFVFHPRFEFPDISTYVTFDGTKFVSNVTTDGERTLSPVKMEKLVDVETKDKEEEGGEYEMGEDEEEEKKEKKKNEDEVEVDNDGFLEDVLFDDFDPQLVIEGNKENTPEFVEEVYYPSFPPLQQFFSGHLPTKQQTTVTPLSIPWMPESRIAHPHPPSDKNRVDSCVADKKTIATYTRDGCKYSLHLETVSEGQGSLSEREKPNPHLFAPSDLIEILTNACANIFEHAVSQIDTNHNRWVQSPSAGTLKRKFQDVEEVIVEPPLPIFRSPTISEENGDDEDEPKSPLSVPMVPVPLTPETVTAATWDRFNTLKSEIDNLHDLLTASQLPYRARKTNSNEVFDRPFKKAKMDPTDRIHTPPRYPPEVFRSPNQLQKITPSMVVTTPPTPPPSPSPSTFNSRHNQAVARPRLLSPTMVYSTSSTPPPPLVQTNQQHKNLPSFQQFSYHFDFPQTPQWERQTQQQQQQQQQQPQRPSNRSLSMNDTLDHRIPTPDRIVDATVVATVANIPEPFSAHNHTTTTKVAYRHQHHMRPHTSRMPIPINVFGQ